MRNEAIQLRESSSPSEIPLPEISRLTSVYWGFFTGGARNVHTDLVQTLQRQGVAQQVIHYFDSVNRGLEGIQHLETDANYKKMQADFITLNSLSLSFHNTVNLNGAIESFSSEQTFSPLQNLVRKLAYKILLCDADAILSLKEQPVNLLVLANRYIEEVIGLRPKPIVVTLHRSDPGIQDRETFEKLKELEQNPETKKYIAGYIGASESTMNAWRTTLVCSDPTRFTFVPNGIDLSVFNTAGRKNKCVSLAKIFAREASPPFCGPVVTIGARNNEEKNIGLFLRASYLFLRAAPEAHVVMCGPGMDKDSLQNFMRQAADISDISVLEKIDIEKRLHTMGKMSQKDMAAIFNISNVTTLTSPSGEADGLVLKEGMACGAIPVSTCCGEPARTVGVPNAEEYMQKPIERGFITGSRGILTSHQPEDVAAAWRYAISNAQQFRSEIAIFCAGLSTEIMGQRYLQKIRQLIRLDSNASKQTAFNY